MKTRILIADDHLAIREGIKHVLVIGFPSVELEEVDNGVEAVRLLEQDPWEMLLLDIDLPGLTGFDVLREMRNKKISVPTLVFSLHREEQIIKQAFQFGAAGYVMKDAADQLLPTIHRVLAGERNIYPALLRKHL